MGSGSSQCCWDNILNDINDDKQVTNPRSMKSSYVYERETKNMGKNRNKLPNPNKTKVKYKDQQQLIENSYYDSRISYDNPKSYRNYKNSDGFTNNNNSFMNQNNSRFSQDNYEKNVKSTNYNGDNKFYNGEKYHNDKYSNKFNKFDNFSRKNEPIQIPIMNSKTETSRGFDNYNTPRNKSLSIYEKNNNIQFNQDNGNNNFWSGSPNNQISTNTNLDKHSIENRKYNAKIEENSKIDREFNKSIGRKEIEVKNNASMNKKEYDNIRDMLYIDQNVYRPNYLEKNQTARSFQTPYFKGEGNSNNSNNLDLIMNNNSGHRKNFSSISKINNGSIYKNNPKNEYYSKDVAPTLKMDHSGMNFTQSKINKIGGPANRINH